MRTRRQALPGAAWLRSAVVIAGGTRSFPLAPVDRPASLAGRARDAARPLKLAFVTNNTSEFWKIAANGVHKYEAEGKVQVDIKMPPNGKTEEQNQILENLVSQGYDAIAVSVIAPKDQVPVLNRAAEKTRLITFDSDAAGLEAPALRRHDQLRGRQDARRADREAPAEGREDGGVRRHLLRGQRRPAPQGHQDAVSGHDIEIVEKREDQTDRAKARSNVEDILNARPDVDARVRPVVLQRPGHRRGAGGHRQEGQGAGRRLRRGGRHAQGHRERHHRGHGGAAPLRDGLPLGPAGCTAWPREFDQAKAEIPADGIENTGVEVIDKDNVADFEKRLAEWKK